MISTRNLTKDFGPVRAVDGLDLDVAEGELVALLGPNGAGKSTTLRMLTTLLTPTSGTASVCGFDVVTQQAQVRRRIGYIGQGNGAGHNQRGRDELVTQGRAYGLSRPEAKRRADDLVDSLDLASVADRRVSTLSGGQRRRLDIAMGLIHTPGLLFLDEPSTGLDPQNRANLQDHIRALRHRHATTVVLTTHYLDEADSMAERVIVVDHGKVIADDPPARLKAALGDRVALGFTSPGEAASAVALVGGSHTGTDVSVPSTDGPAHLPGLLRDLDVAGLKVQTASVTQPTLDDVFLSLTGRSLREGVTA